MAETLEAINLRSVAKMERKKGNVELAAIIDDTADRIDSLIKERDEAREKAIRELIEIADDAQRQQAKYKKTPSEYRDGMEAMAQALASCFRALLSGGAKS